MLFCVRDVDVLIYYSKLCVNVLTNFFPVTFEETCIENATLKKRVNQCV